MTTRTDRPAATELDWAEIPQACTYVTPNGGSWAVSGEARTKTPTIDKRRHGFKGGEALPSSWLNWLFRQLFRGLRHLLEQQAAGDGAGAGLFPLPGFCLLMAVDQTSPGAYLLAFGWKADGAAPHLNVISAQTLALGTCTAEGDAPVTGGASGDIATFGLSFGLPAA